MKAIIEQKLSFITHRLSLTELLIYFREKPQNKTQEEEEGYTSSEEQIPGKHMDKSDYKVMTIVITDFEDLKLR